MFGAHPFATSYFGQGPVPIPPGFQIIRVRRARRGSAVVAASDLVPAVTAQASGTPVSASSHRARVSGTSRTPRVRNGEGT